jgi:hypothetical protein
MKLFSNPGHLYAALVLQFLQTLLFDLVQFCLSALLLGVAEKLVSHTLAELLEEGIEHRHHRVEDRVSCSAAIRRPARRR